jgi:hypothetical protein
VSEVLSVLPAPARPGQPLEFVRTGYQLVLSLIG